MYGEQEVVAILVAAGSSSRMGFDKLFFPINGVEVLRLSFEKLISHPYVDKVVVVAGDNIARVRELLLTRASEKPFCVVTGGETRMHSVAAGVRAAGDADIVAIHDGARPFVSRKVISRVIEAGGRYGGAAPGIPVKDTIKVVRDCFVQKTVERSTLLAVQTPQVFNRHAYQKALSEIPLEEYATITDDCMVMERAGHSVRMVKGEIENLKITTKEDLPIEKEKKPFVPRIGHGYDVHALVSGRKLILGGVDIPHELGLQGHSDGDVLLHAVADAILGAVAMGDIGRHFPDTDPTYKDADSLELLRKVGELVRKEGYVTWNIDATLLCEAPKLAPFISAMCCNIARVLGCPVEAVSVKATTEEGLGFTGKKEGIAAHCVVVMVPKQ